ncbi:hypothetical protein TNCT_306201 [Trichonephila clavata]|uniref:Uncharacterized protein n=1 Tax=Trichonephila clavata TaxID=2740835 RepID=A0A8X6F5S0_TRICU|nr:hypothetical protein TNCT_306201 [Trichonephila clavata]
MEITTLNRLRGALKAKVKKGELFGTGSEQSPSLLEVKLQLNNISALREKIESLRKDYYSLPADVDLSETENELEQLEDLHKTEIRFHFLLSELDNTKNVSVSEVISKENNVLSVNESRQTSIKLPEIPLPQFRVMLQELPYEAQEYHFDRDEEKVKTLGLIWNPKHDTFEFSVSDPTNNSEWTKRSIITHCSNFRSNGSVRPCHCHGEIIHESSLVSQERLGSALVRK